MPDSLFAPQPATPLGRIAARRTPLPELPISRGSMRAWALAACSADVAHADAEFWRLAHELGLTARFDRYLDPGCSQAAALPHERKAAAVLNWLRHLQVEEWLIARSIGSGLLRSDRRYMRALFSRRLSLKQGFRRILADYCALRCLVG